MAVVGIITLQLKQRRASPVAHVVRPSLHHALAWPSRGHRPSGSKPTTNGVSTLAIERRNLAIQPTPVILPASCTSSCFMLMICGFQDFKPRNLAIRNQPRRGKSTLGQTLSRSSRPTNHASEIGKGLATSIAARSINKSRMLRCTGGVRSGSKPAAALRDRHGRTCSDCMSFP
jgi:hypothetical protein